MSTTPFAEYSAVAHAMKGVTFPTRRKQLLEMAKKNHADQNVIMDLQRLAEQHEYKNIAEVMHAIGHTGAPA